MPETAESHAYTLETNRNCTMEITNVSSCICLYNPQVYMESGYVYSPPQPTLRTTKTEVCSFTKNDNTACGAVGVMTYELFHMYNRKCTGTIAVMFSVPFDQNLYKNWIAVGVFEEKSKCSRELYKLMYEGKDFKQFMRAKGDGNGLMHSDKGVKMRACMSLEGRAIVKLELYDH